MSPRSYVAAYHLYVWTLSIVTTTVLMSTKLYLSSPAYGVSIDGTCWIGSTASVWWQLLFIGPLAVYFLVSIL